MYFTEHPEMTGPINPGGPWMFCKEPGTTPPGPTSPAPDRKVMLRVWPTVPFMSYVPGPRFLNVYKPFVVMVCPWNWIVAPPVFRTSKATVAVPPPGGGSGDGPGDGPGGGPGGAPGGVPGIAKLAATGTTGTAENKPSFRVNPVTANEFEGALPDVSTTKAPLKAVPLNSGKSAPMESTICIRDPRGLRRGSSLLASSDPFSPNKRSLTLTALVFAFAMATPVNELSTGTRMLFPASSPSIPE